MEAENSKSTLPFLLGKDEGEGSDGGEKMKSVGRSADEWWCADQGGI